MVSGDASHVSFDLPSCRLADAVEVGVHDFNPTQLPAIINWVGVPYIRHVGFFVTITTEPAMNRFLASRTENVHGVPPFTKYTKNAWLCDLRLCPRFGNRIMSVRGISSPQNQTFFSNAILHLPLFIF